MGLVEIEKKGVVKVDGVSTDEQVAHLGTFGESNLGSLNLAPTTYEYNPSQVQDAGMGYGHIKKESSVLSMCISTTILIIFIIGFTMVVGFLVYKIGKVDFHIFPKLDSYSLNEYNQCMRRCFFILAGMLIGTCILLLLVFNLVVKSRFLNHYLSKAGTFMYAIYAAILNSLLFLGVIFAYFKIVDSISTLLKNYLDKGIITEIVNIDTIQLFKYAVVVLGVIFLVVNIFNVISIVKEKNKFVFEEEM